MSEKHPKLEIDCHQPIVELDHVSYAYPDGAVFRDLNLSIKERDFVGLIGANGTGKTTLLRTIVGLLRPSSGEVRLFGIPLSRFKTWDRIGYVPQKNAINPQFPASVREVVMSGLYNRKRWLKRVSGVDQQKCEEAMQALGIENIADRRIGQLSGGQQQRALLARALINNPELLILDEPFTGVDEATQENFFQILRHMHQHHNITFLMVSHDLQMMKAYLGDDTMALNDRLSLYIKHSHGLENCSKSDLAHSLTAFRASLENQTAEQLVTIGENR